MKTIILPLEKLLSALNKVALHLSTWMLVGMLSIVTLNVILRYFFSYSITWSEEASRYLMVWVTFLLFPYAHEKGTLVAVDFLVAKFRYSRIGVLHAIFLELLCLTVLIIACYQAYFFCMRSMATVTLALRLPMWWVTSVMPYSFALTALASFIWLIKLICCLGDPEKLIAEDEFRKTGLEQGH